MCKPIVPLVVLAAAVLLSAVAVRAQDPAPTVAPLPAAAPGETIVFIRHGEKPPDDKGQLTCRGLNRALALPRVLLPRFGKPDQIFAPLTLVRQAHGKAFSYVRPLMTIEPTAIAAGLPVDTRFPFDGIAALEAELTAPANRNALIFVAWEHQELVQLVRHLLGTLGDTTDLVPDWDGDDYDRIYIVKIRSEAGDQRRASFARDCEGLNGLSGECPIVNVPASGAPH